MLWWIKCAEGNPGHTGLLVSGLSLIRKEVFVLLFYGLLLLALAARRTKGSRQKCNPKWFPCARDSVCVGVRVCVYACCCMLNA